MLPTSTKRQAREAGGVAAPAPAVEVWSCGSDGDEVDIDVEASTNASYVAEQAAVAVDGVGRRFARKADERPRRKQSFGHGRGSPAIALRVEVDLGRVDLDKPDFRPVGEIDRVPVRDVVDARELPDRDRRGRGPSHQQDDRYQGSAYKAASDHQRGHQLFTS